MRNLSYIFSIILFLNFSCQNGEGKPEDAENTNSSPQQQLLQDSIMTVHDRVMPQMSELENLRKRLTTERKKYISSGNNQRLLKINNLLGELNKSENAMWEWMHNYKPDSVYGDQEKMIYLKRELYSVRKMEDLFLSGIAKAQSYFED